MVARELLEAWDLKASREPKETVAPLDSQVREGPPDHLDDQEPKDPPALLDRWEAMDSLDFPVLRVHAELQEKVAYLDCLDFRAFPEETPHRALRAAKDVQEVLGNRVRLVQKGTLDGRVCLEPQGVWEILVSMEKRVIRESQE